LKRFSLGSLLAALGAVALSLRAAPVPAPGSYFPLWRTNPPNVTDLALIYQGGVQRPPWDSNRFAPYVSCVNPATGKEQWLFDGFLFIEFADGRGRSFQPATGTLPAQQADWLRLLDRNFTPDDGLPVLEGVCAATARRVGSPLRPRQVGLTLPTPIPGQTNWGELRGRSLDFRQDADRLAACEWYLDTALEKWKTLAPKQLQLTAFYWVHEGAPRTPDFLQAVARLVHARGCQFWWIPFWQPTPQTANWRACGFDIAWQQPNHFFHPKLPDSRLQAACEFAARNGLGLEMEFDGRLLKQPETFEPRFGAYLDAFTRNGVRDSAAVAWYEGGGALFQLATAEDPATRRHYDRLASFILHRQSLADAQARRAR
jgi:hypothetical protein